jgi:cation transport ATPase
MALNMLLCACVTLQAAEPGSVILEVGGMSCASCVATLESAIKASPGVLEASVNLATNQVGSQSRDMYMRSSGLCHT